MRKIFRSLSIITLLLLFCAGFASAGEQVYFYVTDPAGTPMVMTDSTGSVVWRADYMPFGEETINQATVQNNKLFVGKEKDSESGLYYFGARYNDSAAGRFISPDPIGPVDPRTGQINEKILANPQRLNNYAYGLNNPYRYIDPDGKDIAVIYGYPQGSNRFGHVAAAVTGAGVYSYGTKEALGSSATQYLRNQSEYRDSIVYVIPTTKEQDAAFIDAFNAQRAQKTSVTGNNCADIVGTGLKAAGLLKEGAALTFPGLINSYMMLREDEGKVSYQIDIDKGNKTWGDIDQIMNPFNPVKADK